MTAIPLLNALKRVRRVGPGRYIASCPSSAHAHGDRSRGLSITETTDGRVLICCHMGCPNQEILAAAGFDDWSVLFPDNPLDLSSPAKRERKPFIPAQVFEIARQEIGVVFIVGCDMHKQKVISEQDYERLLMACSRLERIAEAAYGR